VWTGGHHRHKATFSNVSGVEWMLPEKQANTDIVLLLSFHFADHSTIPERTAIASNITAKLYQINKDRVWVGIEPLTMNPLLEKGKTYYFQLSVIKPKPN